MTGLLSIEYGGTTEHGYNTGYVFHTIDKQGIDTVHFISIETMHSSTQLRIFYRLKGTRVLRCLLLIVALCQYGGHNRPPNLPNLRISIDGRSYESIGLYQYLCR